MENDDVISCSLLSSLKKKKYIKMTTARLIFLRVNLVSVVLKCNLKSKRKHQVYISNSFITQSAKVGEKYINLKLTTNIT